MTSWDWGVAPPSLPRHFTSMSRIARAFARRFRELLAEFGARDREQGVQLLFARAHALSSREEIEFGRAVTRVNVRLARQLSQFKRRRGAPPPALPKIICDAGLGGLARWLRAAGCETSWTQDITDAELVREAESLPAVLLTTDSLLLERRPITQGKVKALWVPPTITKHEQLELVRAELDLPPADSRCMSCGGELHEVDKEEFRHQIPPKTYRWVDEYYRCEACGQLYWHGTHWQRITRQLSHTNQSQG